MALSNPQQQRNRVATLARHRHADDPELLSARQDLKAAKLEQYIAKIVASAPPLTPAQRDRLAAILRGGAS
ncbi:hypothetical protein F6B41_02805 [Microbacterium lushaniae]|nr:hypothetical protein F6B41_28480 [Microbacterium lushaniae]KAA9158835.1 hypothetical protein F6B41_02805 [Microbacterium lushaniae]